MARNTQKQFLVMLIENRTQAEGHKTNAKGAEPKKTRRRRKKKVIEILPPPPVIPNVLPATILDIVPPDLWGNFKLGQIIRDTELIKLILKALKWADNDENVERLRNTDLGAVLSNSDLLHDDDLIRLIKSYMGYDGNNNSTSYWNWNDGDADSVTTMEVKVDPNLFFPEDEEDEGEAADAMETDDSRTISVDLNELMGYIEEEGQALEEEADELISLHSPFQCTSCPDRFATHVHLQDHVLTHLIRRSQASEEKETKKGGKKRSKKE